MSNCPSCGGVIGRDCFNPTECAWIGEQQEQQARMEQEERMAALERRVSMVEAGVNLQERVEELEEIVKILCSPGAGSIKAEHRLSWATSMVRAFTPEDKREQGAPT